jgi:predicted metal-dependent hydrolase
MTVTEDPLLALIVRFVMSEDRSQRADAEFVQRQLATLKEYVGKYPADEKQPRAMQWIEQHAANYRREWQKKVLPRQAAERRCNDCPLDSVDGERHCTIHSQWLRLLQAYLNEQLNSQEYVRDALDLLQQHKVELRVQGCGLWSESC